MKLFLLSLLFVKSTKFDAAIGIDLGTTNSCVSVFKVGDRRPSFLQFANGMYTYPSVAYYHEVNSKGIFVTGWEAYTYNLANAVPGRYFFGFKRAMGISDLSEISKVDDFQKSVTYEIRKELVDGKYKPVFVIKDKNNNELGTTDPETLSSEILKELKKEIEKYYNIKSLVITVPAYFTSFQIEATMRSAALAGFEKPDIKKEPVAAAYAYQVINNLNKESKEENIMVFDLGGGTFDVSVVDMQNDVILVDKYGGNNYLGGENVNDNITDYFCKVLKEKKNIDVKANPTLNLRLRRFVEEFKIKMCNNYNADKSKVVYKESFIYHDTDSIDLELSISKFNELNAKFYQDIRDVLVHPEYGMFRSQKGNGSDEPLEKSLITKILLVGGSTRIPYIKNLISEIFPNTKIYDNIDADTIVAEGACLLAANKIGILPDELSIQLVDVVPAHIGICTDLDIFEPILEKDTYIPGSGTKDFTTSHDGQTKVRIKVAQGFRASFKANHYLGVCELEIPPNQRRGEPKIRVTISMDADGTIKLVAVDPKTQKDVKLVFHSDVSRLDKETYAKLQADAEKHKAEDEELKAKYSLQREFEVAIEEVQVRIAQPGISEEDKIDVEGLIVNASKWLKESKETSSKSDIEEKLKKFRESVSAILDKKEEARKEEIPEEAKEQEKTGAREEL